MYKSYFLSSWLSLALFSTVRKNLSSLILFIDLFFKCFMFLLYTDPQNSALLLKYNHNQGHILITNTFLLQLFCLIKIPGPILFPRGIQRCLLGEESSGKYYQYIHIVVQIPFDKWYWKQHWWVELLDQMDHLDEEST